MEKGWIRLHRKTLESTLWNDVTSFRIFIYLLLKATHKDTVAPDGTELKRGQFLRSYRQIADDLSYKEGRGIKRYSISTIKRNIDKLEKQQRVSFTETEHGTLFTILNYDEYQRLEVVEEQTQNGTRNEGGTKAEQTQNNNKNIKNNNNKKNKESSVRKRRKYIYETHHMKLAKLLFNKIRENNSNHREPNFKGWANTFRLMMERDKRTGKEIQNMILWTQQHHFWYKNILSADTLRKQFDRLTLEMKQDKNFKLIKGGKGIETNKSSYEGNYAQYDFSKRGKMQ